MSHLRSAPASAIRDTNASDAAPACSPRSYTIIDVGDHVKAYEFPYGDPERLEFYFIEGLVTGIEADSGYLFYKIAVTREVWDGRTLRFPRPYARFPVNGTLNLFGEASSSVSLLEDNREDV